MSNRLKSTILWTIYIAMVLVGGFTIILIGIGIVTPIFSLKINTSGIEEYINTFGMVLSCLSVGLGVYSIKQANGSEKQTNEILRSIQAVEREQNLSKSLLQVITSAVNNGKTAETTEAAKNGKWKPDNDIT